MGVIILKCFVFIIILIVFYQDMKSQEVSFMLFPLLFFLTIYLTVDVKSFDLVVRDLMMILGFIVIQLSFITLYLMLKFRKLLNPFNGFIGAGDLLFWLAIAPLFSFVNFLLFFILSLAFSAVIFFILKSTRRRQSTGREKLIPLAGMQAAFLLITLFLNRLFWQLEFHQSYPVLTLGIYE